MKITSRFFAGIVFIFLTAQLIGETGPTGAWDNELRLAQQASNQNDEERHRSELLLEAALTSVIHGLAADPVSGSPAESPPPGANLGAATAQAAYSVLAVLYPDRLPALDAQLADSFAAIADTPAAIEAGCTWGRRVAELTLSESAATTGLNPTRRESALTNATTSTFTSAEGSVKGIPPGRYRFKSLAGAPHSQGYVDAIGSAARFDNLAGMVVDSAGNIYLSEVNLGVIRKVSPEGAVTTVAGVAGQEGAADGNGATARFAKPGPLAIDHFDNIYVADAGNHTIRKIDPSGNVTTVAGKAGVPGHVDGGRESARLSSPLGLSVDGKGDIFVVQSPGSGQATTQWLRKIAPDGTVSSLGIALGSTSYTTIQGVCATTMGSLFATYWHAGPMEDLTDVAALTPLDAPDLYGATRVPFPDSFYASAIAGVDEADRVYCSCAYGPIYLQAKDGSWEPRYPASDFDAFGEIYFTQVAVGKSGDLYVFRRDPMDAGRDFGVLEKWTFDPLATGPLLTSLSGRTTGSVGERLQFSAAVVGTPPVTIQWYFNSLPIPGATGSTFELAFARLSDSGNYSVVASDSGGSVTGGPLTLTVQEPAPPSGNSGGGSTASPGGGTGGTVANSSPGGGGSPSPAFSLTSALLLIAAEFRRRRDRSPALKLTAGSPPVACHHGGEDTGNG